MKKLLNIILLLTSLIGYLEWGKGQHSFLAQVEYDLLFGAKQQGQNFMHPFVALPMLGQMLLLITVFQKRPGKLLTITGTLSLSLIMLMILAIGLMSMNMRILASALPFTITAVIVLVQNLRRKRATN